MTDWLININVGDISNIKSNIDKVITKTKKEDLSLWTTRGENANQYMFNLYDIEESSMWYNKTDLGLIIHRQDGFTLARVAKSRYEDMIGKRGQRVFMYNEDSAHFDEHKENDY